MFRCCGKITAIEQKRSIVSFFSIFAGYSENSQNSRVNDFSI